MTTNEAVWTRRNDGSEQWNPHSVLETFVKEAWLWQETRPPEASGPGRGKIQPENNGLKVIYSLERKT